MYRLDKQGNVSLIPINDDIKSFISLGLGPDGKIYAGGEVRGLYRFESGSNDVEEISAPTDNYTVRELRTIPGPPPLYAPLVSRSSGMLVYIQRLLPLTKSFRLEMPR